MATIIKETDNYAAFSMRGGGALLRNKVTSAEVFFQPGDDAASLFESIEALDEIPDHRQAIIFELVASQYV